MAKGRKKEVFLEFKNWLLAMRLSVEQVKVFSMDMFKSYQAGRAAYFPKATVVFDRFHINKHLNELLDKIRKREVKTKYLWLKNEANMTERQQVQLQKLYHELNIDTVKAYPQNPRTAAVWDESGRSLWHQRNAMLRQKPPKELDAHRQCHTNQNYQCRKRRNI